MQLTVCFTVIALEKGSESKELNWLLGVQIVYLFSKLYEAPAWQNILNWGVV